MDKATEREIQKLRAEVNDLRNRFKLMLSGRGGYVNGLIRQDGDHYLEDGHDVYPDGDEFGLWQRLVNRQGIAIYSDHFRSGIIPTGFSWISDGTFNGTPSVTLDYDHRDTYLRVASSSPPHFLAHAITSYSAKAIFARMRTGINTVIGLRIDDGSDDNYAEHYLDPGGASCEVGEYQVTFKYRADGGTPTSQVGPVFPASEFCTLRLYYHTTTSILGYLISESGDNVNMSSFATGATTWTPSRVGFIVSVNSGNPGLIDWFYNAGFW